jgi:hypothetical protein
MGIHWELEGNMLGTKEKWKKIKYAHTTLVVTGSGYLRSFGIKEPSILDI